VCTRTGSGFEVFLPEYNVDSEGDIRNPSGGECEWKLIKNGMEWEPIEGNHILNMNVRNFMPKHNTDTGASPLNESQNLTISISPQSGTRVRTHK
jgi:hypothetical protein